MSDIAEKLKIRLEEFKNKILKVVEREAVNSVKLNFQQQGRPEKWKPKLIPDGRKTLSGKGDLFSSISSSIDEAASTVTIKFGTGYAEIHNKGGRIPVTAKMRKFFWAKFYETKKPVWKNLAMTKKGYIEIPKREFAMLTDEDVNRIVHNIKF